MNTFSRRPQKKGPQHRLNRAIQVQEVRIVGHAIHSGVMPLYRALEIAQEYNLDLVEINPNANPPVCKIVDYQKLLYEEKQRKKNQPKPLEVKEIRLSPNVADHDFDFKSKHAEEFLKDGHKVRGTLMFKGRAILFKTQGEMVLLKFADRLKEVGSAESLPNLEGRKMTIMIAPKKRG